MKKLIFCLCLLPIFLMAQEQNEDILRNVFNDLYGGHIADGTTPLYAFNNNGQSGRIVDGSQFLSDTWEKGLVLMPDNQAYSIKGRYDIHNDQMLILVKDKIQALQPEQVKAVSLGERIFVYRIFQGGDKAAKGYFEILVEGKVPLFMRRTVKTKKANQ